MGFVAECHLPAHCAELQLCSCPVPGSASLLLCRDLSELHGSQCFRMSLLELALEIACFSKSQQRAASLVPCSVQQDPLHSMSWAGMGQLRNFPLPACLHNQRLPAGSRGAFPRAALLSSSARAVPEQQQTCPSGQDCRTSNFCTNSRCKPPSHPSSVPRSKQLPLLVHHFCCSLGVFANSALFPAPFLAMLSSLSSSFGCYVLHQAF